MEARMPWSWRYEKSDGTPVDAPTQRFPTQSDAETWIGESWQELLAAGTDQVVLLEEERVVYGPMSLHPSD
jgi:hypothetical protein